MCSDTEKNSPLISVIIPIYNTEKYLAQCVDSVLNQTYQNYEIILVDDGSTDKSGKICDAYAEKDNRITVVHKSNSGQSSARNAALDIAKGKYIYFLDSDDYIGDKLLEKLVKSAEEKNADVVFFEAKSFVDDEENQLSENIQSRFEYVRKNKYKNCNGQEQFIRLNKNKEYYVCTPLHFYKKEYLDKHNIRFKEGIIHEDNLFSATVYLFDGLTVHLPCGDYMRRLRYQSTMTAKNDEHQMYRYKSMVSVYYGVSELINAVKPRRECIASLINDCFIDVMYAFLGLSLESQNKYKHSFRKIKKHILLHYGKYDYQLARRCAGPISKPFIRAFHFIYKKFK